MSAARGGRPAGRSRLAISSTRLSSLAGARTVHLTLSSPRRPGAGRPRAMCFASSIESTPVAVSRAVRPACDASEPRSAVPFYASCQARVAADLFRAGRMFDGPEDILARDLMLRRRLGPDDAHSIRVPQREGHIRRVGCADDNCEMDRRAEGRQPRSSATSSPGSSTRATKWQRTSGRLLLRSATG